ncbi:MAG TPA: HEAT repeat domain-containing protein [Pyrinomonadaceae bacterium]|jgi:HEAT repeat protein
MIDPKTLNGKQTGARLLFGAAALAVLTLALSAAPARAQQHKELIGRFIQSDNAAASNAFAQGRAFLSEEKWDRAVAALNLYVNQYPSDKNLDAGMYWLAYAYEKQNKNGEAEGVLQALLGRFPKSAWADDAKVLSARLRAKRGGVVTVDENDPNDELRILALRTLCENDRMGCSARVAEVLRSSKSVRVKEAAIILLGRYGGNEAVPALIQLSRNEADEKLKMRAISALGSTNDERALDVLRDLAMGAAYADQSPADSAIHALASHENPRAVAILGEVAVRGQNPKGRTHAIELLSRRRGDNVVDELLRLYDAVPEVQVKKYVLAGLGNRKDPRALSKLVEVARSASDVELRRQAIHTIPNRGDEQDLDVLISLYDSERENELKNHLLGAIGRYDNQRAYQKLEQIVSNNAEPLERRKSAIGHLSRSKDDGVKRFLESLLK